MPKKTEKTLELRRSERIKNMLLIKEGKKVPKLKFNSIPMVNDRKKFPKKIQIKTPKNIVKTNNTLTKNILKTVTSQNDEKVTLIRKKYYNENGRDELYRDKITSNEYNKDKYGNLDSNNFDLAMDNAFNGFYIAVLQLYNVSSFDFKEPTNALEEKGFKVIRWTKLPNLNEFNDVLEKSCQFWLISTYYSQLDNQYLKIIKKFFESGKGVYIWGDNEPYFNDANILSNYLFGIAMYGNVLGGETVGLQKEPKQAGLVVENIINTGLDFLFEGKTIATINDHPDIEPVLYGSANNLVVASYNKDGKRAIIDGGFTRLYSDWKSAGTGRYVKNAAAWLANIENIPI